MQTRKRVPNGQKPKAAPNQTLFVYPPHGTAQNTYGDVIIYSQHDHKQIAAGKYLNDTIISFFMQYHYDHQVPHDLKKRLHVFSSFFFQKIKSIRQNQSSYLNASRWLGSITIFDKDFLFLPVCEKDHWVLVVVCYPSRLPNAQSHKIPDDELYEPAVIVLNSCVGLAPAIKKPLSQFFRAHWKKEMNSDRSYAINNARSSGIRLLFPDLPQQKNSHDCGVYILGYFYSFLRDPRSAYIKMFRGHCMKGWFVDNGIEITRERRRMTQVVRNQMNAYSKQRQEDVDNCELDSQEIHLTTPNSSIDLMDEIVDLNSSVIEIHD